MPIPETEKQHSDLIDLLTDACQTIELVETEDGHSTKQLVLNPKKIWYKTQIVNSNTFARFVLELENFANLAKDAYNNMSASRARVLAEQIMMRVESYNFSIDAKSSESIRDKNNTSSTLIDKINRNKIEKQYTLKEDMKRSFF